MLANYLTLAIRNLQKRKLYSFINVFGLAVGVAVCLIILNYVDFELSYDRHHTNGPHIYRTILTRYLNGEFRDVIPLTGYGTGPALLADIPEVKRMARVHPVFNGATISSTDNKNPVLFREDRLYLADAAFLEIFTFDVLAGDLRTALDRPDKIVITKSAAEKYYTLEEALGKNLKISGFMNRTYTISAIVANQPPNSSITFDFLLPIQDLLSQRQYTEEDGWGWKNFITYIQLHPGTDIEAMEKKMPGFVSRYVNGKLDISFQPLYDIHTRTGLAFDSKDRVSRDKIYFFMLIAIFILFIAWINYINLATARASERAREVGIKKVIGAAKKQLIAQFLVESMIVNFIAVSLALFLAIWLLPFLGEIVGKNLSFDFSDLRLWLFLGGLVVFGSILSGIYPAFILSSFRITTVLKGGTEKAGTFSLRSTLVIFQFACSLILICLTFVVYRQLQFVEKQVNGLNMDQMLIVKGPSVFEKNNRDEALLTFKHQLQNLSFVKNVTTSAGIPGGGYSFTTVMRKQGDSPEEQKSGNVILVDPDFIETYNIEMLSGKVWDPNAISSMKSVIINETALSTFEIKDAQDALNHHIVFEGETFAISGVMKNYHWNSLKAASVPILFTPFKIVAHTFSIHLNTNDYKGSVSQIESLFKNSFPGNPMEYYFLDDFFNTQYKDDQNFGKVFGLFAVFAVLIACSGLFGLTAFITDKKLKEISIRKVLGASTANIISMLSRNFLALVFLASVISLPIMWYATNNWLASFAFRMPLTWDIFVVPIFILTTICLVTVSANILRGACANPARILKSE